MIQRVPLVLTSERDFQEREVVEGFRAKVVASVTLPSLGGGHCLTTGKMSAFVQVRSVSCDSPEDVVRGSVVEQIETLFLAVINLQRP